MLRRELACTFFRIFGMTLPGIEARSSEHKCQHSTIGPRTQIYITAERDKMST